MGGDKGRSARGYPVRGKQYLACPHEITRQKSGMGQMDFTCAKLRRQRRDAITLQQLSPASTTEKVDVHRRFAASFLRRARCEGIRAPTTDAAPKSGRARAPLCVAGGNGQKL